MECIHRTVDAFVYIKLKFKSVKAERFSMQSTLVHSGQCRVVQELDGVVGGYYIGLDLLTICYSGVGGGCPQIYILFPSPIIAKLHDSGLVPPIMDETLPDQTQR